MTPNQHIKSTPSPPTDIAEYIRHIFQDKNGNFWFGTNHYGVAHYDGNGITYFSNAQGFDGRQITGIAEDQHKNLWFATDQGVVKMEWTGPGGIRKKFINYSNPLYFEGQRFWSIFVDNTNTIWAGAERGIYTMDGKSWVHFALPYPEEISGEFITKATSWSITQDRNGNMWFSTNGFGAFKYDGKHFTRLTTDDGLADDSVDIILEDSNRNLWFGTRWGGVSQYDGESFTNFTQANNSIGNDEVCVIYEDRDGGIWMSSEGFGVYKYDGKGFINYSQNEGLAVRAVQDIFQDRDGNIWAGGGGGLYRLQRDRFYKETFEVMTKPTTAGPRNGPNQ